MPSIECRLESLLECSVMALLLTAVLSIFYAMLRTFPQLCLEFGEMFVELIRSARE
jgi:hypothetical protein